MLQKLITGGRARKSRLHDERGNRVSVDRLLRNGTRATWSGLLRVAADIRPERPWISYDGQEMIAAHLRPDSRVLEYGSGMSTVWYSRHAGFVLSHEDDQEWHGIAGQTMKARPNVVHLLRTTPDEYARVDPEHREPGFDLVMIDGSYRDQCMDDALQLLRPGAMVYLDNSDKSNASLTGDIPAAGRQLEAFAREHRATLTRLVDFAPTQFFVNEAMIMVLPGAAR